MKLNSYVNGSFCAVIVNFCEFEYWELHYLWNSDIKGIFHDYSIELQQQWFYFIVTKLTWIPSFFYDFKWLQREFN